MPVKPNNVSACAQASLQNNGDTHEHNEGEPEAPILTGADVVPFTSRMVAAARALESRRPDRLFDDYLAELLAGSEAFQVYEEALDVHTHINDVGSFPVKNEENAPTKADGSYDDSGHSLDGIGGQTTRDVTASRYLAIRTRFGDDFFVDCTRPTRNIKQIVLLGAGMDTRGYRLRASPDTTGYLVRLFILSKDLFEQQSEKISNCLFKVFEVDQTVVLAFKAKVLSGSSAKKLISDKRLDGVGEARVVGIEANFNKPGWEVGLIEAGFDPALPSAWILEGLTMYLEEDAIAKLVQVVANLSSPRSAVFAEVVSSRYLELSKSRDNDVFGSLKWGIDDPQAFFEGYFSDTWSFKCMVSGTPGEFPDGADYSVGYKGKGHKYVIGYMA